MEKKVVEFEKKKRTLLLKKSILMAKIDSSDTTDKNYIKLGKLVFQIYKLELKINSEIENIIE